MNEIAIDRDLVEFSRGWRKPGLEKAAPVVAEQVQDAAECKREAGWSSAGQGL